jgi:WD40 repeat protein
VADAAEPLPQPGANAARTDRHGDPLPQGALLRLGTVRYRAGEVNDAALSPDGKTLATASETVITLWDLATGRPLHRLRGAEIPSYSFNGAFLCFSPDGKRLVSLGGWDWIPSGLRWLNPRTEPAVHVWDVATGAEIHRFHLPGNAEQRKAQLPRFVWFTPGGKEIGVLMHSGVAYLLDPTTGKECRRWEIGQSPEPEEPFVTASPDGKLLALCDPKDDKALLLVDVNTGREVRRVKTTTNPGIPVFSPDGAILALSGRGSAIRLFEVATGKEIKALAEPGPKDDPARRRFLALAFSPDGKVLYAGADRGRLLRWRMPGAEPLAAMAVGGAGGADGEFRWTTGLLPSPDARSVISVGQADGLIRRWDTTTGKEIPAPEGFSSGTHCRLSPDGRRVAAGDYAGKLVLFDAATGLATRVLRGEGLAVTDLRWSPDGRTLAVGQVNRQSTYSVGLWDVRAGREVRVLHLPTKRGDPMGPLTFSPDGRHLLTSRDGLCMWDATTGVQRWNGKDLLAAVLSPDGKTVAARSDDEELVLSDGASGEVRSSHKIGSNQKAFMIALEFSPEGSWLATSYSDSTIRIHDPSTGNELSHFHGSADTRPNSLAFSPDGKWLLITAMDDKVVRLWEVATGKELLRLTGERVPVAAEFGPGGRTAIASYLDGTALVWDLRPAAAPAGATPATLWDSLVSGDGATVYRTIRTLADDPKTAVALLREKTPARAVDEKRVRQLVADLDADAFPARQQATRELSALDLSAMPLLKKLQRESNSAEVRRRLGEVVEALTRPRRKDIRCSRSVQVLELAATAAARQLLRDWAASASSVALAEESAAALARMEHFDELRGRAGKP